MSVANSGPSALVPGTASTPIAQAGSPLHHILASTSAATGQQLTHLFSQLQANVLTPGEFMARAKVLLDPAQFEILDGIRRRHGGRPSVDGAQQQSTTASAATLNSGIPSSSPSAGQSSALSMPTAAGTSGMTIHTPATGVPLLSAGATTATPTLAAPPSALQSTSASIPTTSLPPTSSNTGSAPVRKRNTEATFTSTTSAESKVAPKRVKTEHQALAPGVNGPTAQVASPAVPPSFPSTPGPSTPGGAPSPGVFNRVSLPGQQKTSSLAMGAGTGIASGAGVSNTGASGSGAAGRSSASGIERVNYDNITDVMGYVGVDLREESDNIMRDNDGYSRSGGGYDGQDRTRIQNFISAKLLKAKVEHIAQSHKLQNIDGDVLAYLAMATQERLRGLVEQMVLASKHRGRSLATMPPPMYDEDHPMYKVAVSQDVKRQLLAIERVEREEETKRKELIADRERKLAAGEDLDEAGDSRGSAGASGAKKGKKQKEGGPGVSARNMTDEARKKVANQTALGFAGGSGRSYSWMMGGAGAGGDGGAGGTASPLPSASTPGASSGVPASTGSPSASGGVSMGSATGATGSGAAKPGLSRGATMPLSTVGPSSMALGARAGGIGSPSVSGNMSSSALGPPSLVRGNGAGGGSMILPPSTVGRPSGLRDTARKINVKDALFCLERDRGGGGGQGSGQRVLIKSYAKRLK
ncbi:hypothetical protein BGZ54_007361 [Gamsiella multidivaricata]|nr:hypothetical protein BGZ54_007361 [Gamsiella multidivaricata]